MTTRSTAVAGFALLALVAGLLAGCTSASPSAAADASSSAPAEGAAPHPEQALLEELAIANRILARELDILDIQGHTSARSQANPNHWYMPRFVAPGGAVASDMTEYDVDSIEVHGPRTDNAREIYLHAEIYKARPDVMAIVHAHTPEFVAFGMSSVPLLDGETQVPVFDIRPYNEGRNGIISNTSLGRVMAETLGQHGAVLLWGHGIAMTGPSLPEAVARVDALRDSAQLQQAAIAMGSTWTPRPATRNTEAVERMWAYHAQQVLEQSGGRLPTEPEPMPEKPSDPAQAAAHDVMLANRILANDLNLLDALGYVSMRNPQNANTYVVAPDVAPGAVTAADVVEREIANDETSTALLIYTEIYRARPDVNAILYARSPEIVAFTSGQARLRPVVNGAAFIGDGLPMFNLPALGSEQSSGGNPPRARAVVNALGDARAVLLAADGVVVTGRSIYNVVGQAYQLRQNAIIQRQAIQLGGQVTYLNQPPDAPIQELEAPARAAPQGGSLGPPEGRDWVYWAQNVSLD